MTSDLIEIPLEDGGSIILAVSDVGRGSSLTRGRVREDSGSVARATRTFEEGVARVRPAVTSLIDSLRALPQRPTEIQVEFGIEFTAEAGAIIASASTTANFAVTMTWRSSGQEEPGD